MIRHLMLSIVCWVLAATSILGSDTIISDLDLDIKILKKSVESLENAEKLAKKLDHIQARYTKAATADKKAKVLDDLHDLKVDLVKLEAFPDAWRGTLAKALKIKDEHVTNTYPTVDEVHVKIAKEQSRLLEKHFPLALRAKLESDAIARFPTNAVGDMVNIMVNGRAISGRINSLSEISAMIGSTSIPLSDLPPSFHVRRMTKSRRDYVRENFTEKRQAYLKSLQKKLPAHMFHKNSYIEYEGDWVPVIKVTDRIEARISALKAEADAEEAKRQALISNIKTYGIMAAGGLAILAVVGLAIAAKARKKG